MCEETRCTAVHSMLHHALHLLHGTERTAHISYCTVRNVLHIFLTARYGTYCTYFLLHGTERTAHISYASRNLKHDADCALSVVNWTKPAQDSSGGILSEETNVRICCAVQGLCCTHARRQAGSQSQYRHIHRPRSVNAPLHTATRHPSNQPNSM